MVDNDGKRIQDVLNNATCPKHNAKHGFACWEIPTKHNGYMLAVCGPRIKRAGFVGAISPASLSKTPSKPLRLKSKRS